jgi:hypothetical protein
LAYDTRASGNDSIELDFRCIKVRTDTSPQTAEGK